MNFFLAFGSYKVFLLLELRQIVLLGSMLRCQLWSVTTWNALLQALLAFKVSTEKLAIFLMVFPVYVLGLTQLVCMFLRKGVWTEEKDRQET